MAKLDQDRNSTHGGRHFLLIAFFFVASAVFSSVIVAAHKEDIKSMLARLSWNKGPPQAVTVAKGPEIRWQPHPLRLTPHLASTSVAMPDMDFSLFPVFASTDFCTRIHALLPELELSWKDSPVLDGGAECTGLLGGGDDMSEGEHNSLFVQVRRDRNGRTSAVRLKLVDSASAPPPSYQRSFKATAGKLLQLLLAFDAPPLIDKVNALSPFDVTRRGLSARLFEEQISPGSYNLILRSKCSKYDCPDGHRGHHRDLSAPDPEGEASRADAANPQQD